LMDKWRIGCPGGCKVEESICSRRGGLCNGRVDSVRLCHFLFAHVDLLYKIKIYIIVYRYITCRKRLGGVRFLIFRGLIFEAPLQVRFLVLRGWLKNETPENQESDLSPA
jgi:hypothetical protein